MRVGSLIAPSFLVLTMRGIDEVFADTLFLGATRGMKRDEDRLWMIAEHLEDDELALAFLSLKKSNLLLTPRRVLELKPHLDVGGMWNVLRFRGYELANEVALAGIREVGVAASRGGGRLQIVTETGEQTWLVPVSSTSEDSAGNAQAFATRIRDAL